MSDQPCLVQIAGMKIPGTLVMTDDFGMSSVRFAHDELTYEERAALSWRGKRRECWKVVERSRVQVTT